MKKSREENKAPAFETTGMLDDKLLTGPAPIDHTEQNSC